MDIKVTESQENGGKSNHWSHRQGTKSNFGFHGGVPNPVILFGFKASAVSDCFRQLGSDSKMPGVLWVVHLLILKLSVWSASCDRMEYRWPGGGAFVSTNTFLDTGSTINIINGWSRTQVASHLLYECPCWLQYIKNWRGSSSQTSSRVKQYWNPCTL